MLRSITEVSLRNCYRYYVLLMLLQNVLTKLEYLFYVWTNRICMHDYIPE